MRKLLIGSSILLMIAGVFAQGNRQYFEIPDFNGGINVQSDSANLQPNQALVMENFIFSSYGALKKRNGYGYWNRVPFPATDTVKDIHHLYRSKGSNQLLIATNNYIYVSPFTDTVTVDASWPDNRLGYNKGTVDAYDDSNLVYGTDTWWLLSIKIGDIIEIDNDSIFTIDSILADTLIELDRNYQSVADHDTADSPYNIYRTIIGDPYITSWNSNGYIADSDAPAFYYADSQMYWMSVIDSGTVDTLLTSADTFNIDLSDTIWTLWRVYSHSRDLHRNIYITTDSVYDTVNALINGGYEVRVSTDWWYGGQLVRTIIADVGNGFMETNQGVGYQWDDHWVDNTGQLFVNDVLDTMVLGIVDSSKAWNENSLVGDFIINGKAPLSYFPIITNAFTDCQMGEVDDLDSTFNTGDRYYICEAIPYGDVPDSVRTPHFSQIEFHKNVFYAFGYGFTETGDTTQRGFIFNSDVGLPKIWSTFEGFDLSLNDQDKPKSLFKLHDNLMISTKNSIYQLTGWPPALGDGALIEILYGTGIDSYNSVVNRNNRESYLARKDGFYTFKGAGVNKISLLIDPLIDRYRKSGYELGYFDENVYFSFVDSIKTFLYHEPTETFTSLAFGISVFDNQATLVDSSYFLFSHPSIIGDDSSYGGHIFKYPISGYQDLPDTLTVSYIPFTYKTGWMDLGSPNIKKQFDKFYINTVKRSDTLWIRFRVDFDTTTREAIPIADSVSLQYSYRFMNVLDITSTLQGRYLQVEVAGNSGQQHTIGEWGVEYHAISED